jgi:hypothetical protein
LCEYDWQAREVSVGMPRCYVRWTEHTGALVSSVGASVHAPAGLYEIKGDESSAGSDKKNIRNFCHS